MQKTIFLFLFTILIIGCSIEYKPNGKIPNEDDSVDAIFSDSIGDLKANVKLEFLNDSCRSISASYGENNEIFLQIILVENDYISSKNCLEKKIMPLFENYKGVKKNKNEFYATASDENYEIATWFVDNYVFYMKIKKEYVEKVVANSYFLEFK